MNPLKSPVWVEVAEDVPYKQSAWSVDQAKIEQAFLDGKILKAKRRRADGVMTVVIKRRGA